MRFLTLLLSAISSAALAYAYPSPEGTPALQAFVALYSGSDNVTDTLLIPVNGTLVTTGFTSNVTMVSQFFATSQINGLCFYIKDDKSIFLINGTKTETLTTPHLIKDIACFDLSKEAQNI